MARLYPLFSGSKGNSTYIASSGEGVLIDVGRSSKQMSEMLSENEIDIKSIAGIFVTHEHSDHVKGLRVFASKYKIKVYASGGTLEALFAKGLLDGSADVEEITDKGVCLGNMQVIPFHTPHDCVESFGYIVNTADGRRVGVVTDIGFVSDEVHNNMKQCDVVLIESNHDVRMLQNSSYPYPLKRRILSDVGHLSNDACSKEILGLAKLGVNRFILAHLSDENNMPDLAYQTTVGNLMSAGMRKGIDFDVLVAPRENFIRKSVVF